MIWRIDHDNDKEGHHKEVTLIVDTIIVNNTYHEKRKSFTVPIKDISKRIKVWAHNDDRRYYLRFKEFPRTAEVKQYELPQKEYLEVYEFLKKQEGFTYDDFEEEKEEAPKRTITNAIMELEI
jgi:hypothetical protein